MSRVIVFTVHKAASTGLYNLMARLAKRKGVPLYSANLKTLPDIRENDASLTQHIAGREGVFGPIRRPLLIDGLYDSRMILHLRDPRDCLTSMYYSWAYSHSGVPDTTREWWKQMGIDGFVLHRAPGFFERYEHYRRHYLENERVLFLTYEDMVSDYASWVRSFVSVFEVPGAERLIKKLCRENRKLTSKVSAEEDHTRHVRQLMPGDYLRKLNPDTIRELGDRYGDILCAFGYEV